jgi:hypothetical protein
MVVFLFFLLGCAIAAMAITGTAMKRERNLARKGEAACVAESDPNGVEATARRAMVHD